MSQRLRIGLLTREYPPENYGGAGVHVEHLAKHLLESVELSVHCFGAPRNAPEVKGSYKAWSEFAGDAPELSALRTFSVDLLMARDAAGLDLVHSHTWYANFGGHLAKLLHGIPHVMTTHSLEPLRPWKAEQLGGGYALSSFSERTAILEADAVVAVSHGMRSDILRTYPGVLPERVTVIHNGVEPDQFQPDSGTEVLERFGISRATPCAVFVGRITRQKGIVHLLDAARYFSPSTALVLCAGEPDTADIDREVRERVAALQRSHNAVIWIDKMLSRRELVQILSHARVFVCPSIYEPFGIVNLEAMACGIPVVASRVGGIPEIVEEGRTGYLVEFEPDGSALGAPRDPERFARDLAEKVNLLFARPDLAREQGEAGRRRVQANFSWASIAQQTFELYSELIARGNRFRPVPRKR